MILLRNKSERMIYRRLDYDLLVLFYEHIDCHSYALDYSRDVTEPFLLNLPSVMRCYPVAYSRAVILRFCRVAEDRMFHSLQKRFCDEVGGFEIHVGNPHGDQIVFSEILSKSISLYCSRALALDDSVEIVVFHSHYILDTNIDTSSYICVVFK